MLLGNNNFKALGLIKVEVTMKKINKRKTMSVMDDMLKLGFAFFALFIAMVKTMVLKLYFSFFNSYITSMKSDWLLSIWFTILSIRAVIVLYAK